MSGYNRKRIAFVTGAAYAGGAEKYLELLACGLDRDRFEPVLITPGSPGLESLRSAVRDAGVLLESIEGNPCSSVRGAWLFSGIIRRFRPEIVHINMPGPFDCSYGFPALLSRLSGVRRIVTTEHLPMVESFAKAKVLRSLNMPHVSRFITVSEDNRAHLVEKHGVPAGKIRVVHNGIPDPGWTGREKEESGGSVNLLVAGALEERKGQMVILAAMDRLPDRIHLSVAGEGPLRSRLEAELASGRYGERVSLLGGVENMPELVAQSDILIVPSLIEATPYVILEAMAAGRPIVASAIFGIPEQVDDGVTGILVPPGEESFLADAILRLSADPGLMRRMGEAGRKRYEDRFTLDRFMAGTLKVYEELF